MNRNDLIKNADVTRNYSKQTVLMESLHAKQLENFRIQFFAPCEWQYTYKGNCKKKQQHNSIYFDEQVQNIESYVTMNTSK